MSSNLNQLPLSAYGPTYGSLYFSTIMSTAFYSVTCMQTFFYYVHYQNDPLRTKCFVAVSWALNTVHEAIAILGAYKYLKSSLINTYFLPSELILQLLLTVLVAVSTQGFFIYRIYIFNGKNIVVPIIWVILAILQLVFAAVYVGKALYNANNIQIVDQTALIDSFKVGSQGQTLATACLAIAAGVDILISIFLTFLLVRKRTAARLTTTAHLLQRLAVFAVNTGVWTATFALLSVILLHAFPSNLLYAVFGVPLCSLYCNTLLGNLNARMYLRGEATTYNISAGASESDTTRQDV